MTRTPRRLVVGGIALATIAGIGIAAAAPSRPARLPLVLRVTGDGPAVVTIDDHGVQTTMWLEHLPFQTTVPAAPYVIVNARTASISPFTSIRCELIPSRVGEVTDIHSAHGSAPAVCREG